MVASGTAVRRVVTANDEGGKGSVGTDRQVPPLGAPTLPDGVEAAILWVIEDSPARPGQGEPRDGAPPWKLGEVPPRGARWTMLTIQPGAPVQRLHKTDTVDLVVVTSGEIWLLMEDGSEQLIRTGECVVQRETVHGWDNRSDGPCTMSVVMVSTLGEEG